MTQLNEKERQLAALLSDACTTPAGDPQHPMKTFHGVGGVNQSFYFLLVFKIGTKLCPVGFPDLVLKELNRIL